MAVPHLTATTTIYETTFLSYILFIFVPSMPIARYSCVCVTGISIHSMAFNDLQLTRRDAESPGAHNTVCSLYSISKPNPPCLIDITLCNPLVPNFSALSSLFRYSRTSGVTQPGSHRASCGVRFGIRVMTVSPGKLGYTMAIGVS